MGRRLSEAEGYYKSLLAYRNEYGASLTQDDLDGLNEAITEALRGWKDITKEIEKAGEATDDLNGSTGTGSVTTGGGSSGGNGAIGVYISVAGNADKKTVDYMASEIVKKLRRNGL
jgi:uncharacterized membrane protein YgcG